jgi:hypothetical protein
MRCVAGVGLLALVGCNQIFSLSPTREFDAAVAIDVAPELPHVELTWQVASVLRSGDPDPTITFPPIMPAPDVRIATLDGMWEPASYSSDGWIVIPPSYVGTTWRLEYTIVDGVTAPVPHEVQWAPEDKLGHLTIPLFGRVARDPLPVDGAYKIKPTGAAPYFSPAVITTGLWTEGAGRVDLADPMHTTVDYAFTRAVPLSGKKGRPDPERGDRAFLLDYIVGTDPDARERDCQIAVGSVVLDSSEVQTGIPTVRTPTSSWDTARPPVATDEVTFAHTDRLQNALGTRRTTVTGSVLVGYAPSTSMPGLAGTRASALPVPPATVKPTVLPIPVMVTLVQCPYSPNPGDQHRAVPPPNAIQPVGLAAFPRIVHIQLVDSRSALGIDFPSGMETVITLAAGVAKIEFPAALATRMTLTTPSHDVVDLAGDSEQVPVGLTAGPYKLDFIPEAGADLRADYHDVVLHRLDGTTLRTDRIYTVTAPTVRIDSSVLRPSSIYVFEIRTYKGHPSAARGDFAPVDYPYGAAIVFTRTFRTS